MASYLKSIGHFVAHEMLPLTVEALFKNPAFNTVKFGSMCVLAGATATIRSEIPQIVKEKFFGTAPGMQPLPFTKGRLIKAACGGALVAYGVYNICSGITTIWHQTFGSPEEILTRAVSKLNECPQTRDLWNLVHQKGEIAIRFGHATTGGSWDSLNRTIILNPQANENTMLLTLVFELCNAKRPKSADYSLVYRRVAAGDVGLQEFVKKMMEWEWPTLECHHQAVKQCLINQRWEDGIDRFRNWVQNFPTFEDFWKVYQIHPDFSQHRHNLRKKWIEFIKDRFCQTHPHSLDCTAI